jgi:serine/threonine protein phosphatase PrpC
MAMATKKRRLTLDCGTATDKAQRAINEDYAEWWSHETSLVALLADGMGGGEEGERFSKQAVLSAMAELQQDEGLHPPDTRLQQAFEVAIQEVRRLRMSEPRYKASGSTLTGLLIEQGDEQTHFFVANIGDSRAYRIDANNKIFPLTSDHTQYQKLLRSGANEAEARADPQSQRLTHVLGSDLSLSQVPEWFNQGSVDGGDTFLLCTDGIHKHVSESDMVHIVRKGTSAQDAAKALVQLAIEKKARDNVTAIVVQHKQPPRNPVFPIGGIVLAVLLVLGIVWGVSSVVLGSSEGTDVPEMTTITENLSPTLLPTSTAAPNPTATLTPTATPTATPTDKPRPTVQPAATSASAAQPAATSAATAIPTATPVPTAQPTATPVPTAQPTATPVPTAQPTATPVPTAQPTATPVPTAQPTATSAPTVPPTATSAPTVPPAAPSIPTVPMVATPYQGGQ